MSEVLTISLDDKKKKEAEIQEILNPIVKRTTETLTRLHSLKSHRLLKYWRYRNEYAQRDVPQKTED